MDAYFRVLQNGLLTVGHVKVFLKDVILGMFETGRGTDNITSIRSHQYFVERYVKIQYFKIFSRSHVCFEEGPPRLIVTWGYLRRQHSFLKLP